jgi:hypothetical protein
MTAGTITCGGEMKAIYIWGMRNCLIILLILLSGRTLAQDCGCSSQLAAVIRYYEANNPAFQKLKGKTKSYADYLVKRNTIEKEAGRLKEEGRCIVYLDRYVALLKDHHSEIGFNLKRMDLSTAEKIDSFKKTPAYLRYRKIQIDTAKLLSVLATKKLGEIEGIYSNGGSLVFGIIPKEKEPGKYLGVVLKGTRLLDPGHILLELERTKGNEYAIQYHVGLLGFNFKTILKTQVVDNGLMPSFGFSKTDTRVKEKPYEFKVLNDSTNYLRISSFDSELTAELNVFYDSIHSAIISKPLLVIDIRNNGGGSEQSFFNLLPYIYEKPFKLDSALVWVSPDNIRRYEETGSANYTRLIERMKAAKPFSFIRLGEEPMSEWALDGGTAYPKKVALLYNKGTASSGEGMILYMQQSKKVITIGENSGGYIGYGNVMTTATPCGQYSIRSTTTQYFDHSKYEYVGIAPEYKPSKSVDWINYASKLLQKKSNIKIAVKR